MESRSYNLTSHFTKRPLIYNTWGDSDVILYTLCQIKMCGPCPPSSQRHCTSVPVWTTHPRRWHAVPNQSSFVIFQPTCSPPVASCNRGSQALEQSTGGHHNLQLHHWQYFDVDWKHTYFCIHIRTLFCTLLSVFLAMMVLAVIYLGHFRHLYVMYCNVTTLSAAMLYIGYSMLQYWNVVNLVCLQTCHACGIRHNRNARSANNRCIRMSVQRSLFYIK